MARPLRDFERRQGARTAAVLLAIWLGAVPAMAASEPTGDAKKVGTERIVVPPAPAPTAPAPSTPPPVSGPESPLPHAGAPAPASAAPAAAAKAPLPPAEIHKGIEGLPPQVVKMRQRLLDAAYSGDMQRLKIAAQTNETPPIFSINEIGDPIAYLKAQSGDGQGLEILAILSDILESSWTRLNPGTPQEIFVWPAFVAMPLDKLEPGQTVEIYKIVTSSDLEEMKSVGRYTFYTVGIGPDGTWHWFKPAD